jgi:hypothetical protein
MRHADAALVATRHPLNLWSRPVIAEESMKAYHIDRFGSIGGIVRRASDDPRPGLREVLMRVRASSLNYRDLMVLRGAGRGPARLGSSR